MSAPSCFLCAILYFGQQFQWPYLHLAAAQYGRFLLANLKPCHDKAINIFTRKKNCSALRLLKYFELGVWLMNHIHHGHFHRFLYNLLITTRNFNCKESREINGACQFLWSHLSMLIGLHKNVDEIYRFQYHGEWMKKLRQIPVF